MRFSYQGLFKNTTSLYDHTNYRSFHVHLDIPRNPLSPTKTTISITMLSILIYPALVPAFLLLYLTYTYITNIFKANALNFPTIHFPLFPQNTPLWSIFGPIGRLTYKRYLPTWLFNRVALLIYGLEFYQGDHPWRTYVEPQVARNPNLKGKGKSYVLVTGGRLEFWTWDAEIAREISGNPKVFNQLDLASVVMNVFGENVLTTDGANWARHRRIVAGAVTERVSPIVWEESVRQTRQLLESVYRRSENGVTNDMFDGIKKVAIHVLYRAGMGNQQDFEGEEEKIKEGMKLSYIDAVKIINENVSGPTILPTSFLRNYPKTWAGAKWLHELAQAKIEFPVHTREALAKEKEASKATGKSRNNVMSALIAASEQNDGDEEKGKKGPALTDEELVGNLYIFTAAGFDTTANTLSYTLLFLARYPRWQEWLMEELDELLPSSAEADFDYTSIFPKAHRTLALMLETLRLFPPIIHISKMTRVPVTLTTPACGTFTIPAYSTVYVNNVMLHRDPAVWRNLNMTSLENAASRDDEDGLEGDEQEYRPSRWINPKDSESPIFQPPKGGYLPWNAGPRTCPGQKMAQVEFVAIIATLFSRHRLEVVRKTMPVKGAEEVHIPESDDALMKRLDAVMEDSMPKLTLEMNQIYNVQPGDGRGLPIRWISRK